MFSDSARVFSDSACAALINCLRSERELSTASQSGVMLGERGEYCHQGALTGAAGVGLG